MHVFTAGYIILQVLNVLHQIMETKDGTLYKVLTLQGGQEQKCQRFGGKYNSRKISQIILLKRTLWFHVI